MTQDIPTSTPPDPHTTEAKAALCDAVAPFVTSLAATAEAQLRARASVADPLTLALARLCAREVNTLMRGEPQLRFVRPVRFAGDSVSPASLAAGLRTLEAALGAFRARYYGWHYDVHVPGWHIAGPDGQSATLRLLTRSTEAPPPGAARPGRSSPEMVAIRNKLIQRITELKRGGERDFNELEALKARIKRGELIEAAPQRAIEASKGGEPGVRGE